MTSTRLIILMAALTGVVSTITILMPLWVFFIGMGLPVPNAMAAAINRYPNQTGLASAMSGFLQFSGWGGAGLAVGLPGGDGPIVFAGVFGFVGLANFTSFILLHGRPRSFRP
ncbi:MAG: hypothetical protein GDA49_00540 [Rhodospirillales bacterium]|nr:hypothetical protein [Rhodospirillales bacterium]